ncbi:MAG: YfhO family protein [Pirellulaceae bacterium]
MKNAKSHIAPLAVFAVLAGVVMACLHPLAAAPGDLLVGSHRHGQNDLSTSFVAYHGFPSYCLRQFGQLPTWNPYKFSGAPFHGNPESGAFYPANWLVWLTGDVAVMGWIMAAHLLLGGLGAYRLARSYALHRSAACVAGVVYSAAPFLLAQAAEGHYTLICAAAWIPWAFWAFERMRAGRVWAFPLLAAVLAICFFAGHAQTTYYLVVILTAIRVADAVRMLVSGQRQPGVRLLTQWVLLGVTVGGLVAVDLLPIWSYTRFTVRGAGMNLATAGEIHAGVSNLAQLVYPGALGDADDYHGPGGYYWETLCYFGVAPLALALIGVAARRRKWFVRQWSIVAGASLLFAMGTMGGLFPLCFLLLPGSAMFRAPSRMILFCSLAVAVLAAAGAQFALQAFRARRRRAPAARNEPSFGLVGMMAVVALNPRLKLPVGAILVGVCGVELVVFGGGLFSSLERDRLDRESPIVEFLTSQKGVYRVAAPQSLLSDYEAWTAGVEKVQAFDPAPPALHASVALQTAEGEAEAVMRRELFGFRAPVIDEKQSLWLDLMQVRYVVQPASTRPPTDGWSIVQRGVIRPRFAHDAPKDASPDEIEFVIYERRDVLPRAFVLGEVQAASSMKASLAKLAGLAPRREMLIERDVLVGDDRQSFAPAEIVSYTPNRVEVQATLEKPGYLYLGDAWLSGWTAAAGGQPLPVLRANAAFRAVPLDAGVHRVVFQYVPGSFAIGRWLTAVASACLATWCLVHWRKRPDAVSA